MRARPAEPLGGKAGEVGESRIPIARRRWSRAGNVGKGGNDSLEFSTLHMHLPCSDLLFVHRVTLTKQCFPCIMYIFIYNTFIMGSK